MCTDHKNDFVALCLAKPKIKFLLFLDNFNILLAMYKASDYRCLKPEANKVSRLDLFYENVQVFEKCFWKAKKFNPKIGLPSQSVSCKDFIILCQRIEKLHYSEFNFHICNIILDNLESQRVVTLCTWWFQGCNKRRCFIKGQFFL